MHLSAVADWEGGGGVIQMLGLPCQLIYVPSFILAEENMRTFAQQTSF